MHSSGGVHHPHTTQWFLKYPHLSRISLDTGMVKYKAIMGQVHNVLLITF